jgi:hypothetical protein
MWNWRYSSARSGDARHNRPRDAFSLRRADFLGPALSQRRRLVRQFELWPGRVVLHVVR